MTLTLEYSQSSQIYSVSALTELVRGELELKFPFVWVRGEVTDYSISNNGHMYFSLKDANSLLQCVWFAGRRRHAAAQNFDPLTGEVFVEPRVDLEAIMRNGLELICAGGLSLYAKSGRYQLIVEHAELSGQGALALELEQRKAKYAAAGYFSLERKRALPTNPSRIALITSPKGAAIHDFLKLAALRGLASHIRLFPVTVQGKGAALKMAQAISEANEQGWGEVIVLIRGGGSVEDLMEFNEPVLVEAIFHSRLPVLAGIGHEVDVFLSDLTADVRAATPSHAAQLLWPLRRDIWQKLDDLDLALGKSFRSKLERLEEKLRQREKALDWLSPALKFKRLESRLQDLRAALGRQIKNVLTNKDLKLRQYEVKLRHTLNLHNNLQLAEQKRLWLTRAALKALQALTQIKETKLQEASRRLDEEALAWLKGKEAKLSQLVFALHSLNPLAPLEKGYALLSDKQGLIHSVRDCKQGQAIQARMLDGTLNLKVLAIHEKEENSNE